MGTAAENKGRGAKVRYDQVHNNDTNLAGQKETEIGTNKSP